MNNPCLYKNANAMQRHDAEQIIKDYSHKIQWRLDGGDTLLDIGSGCGDVLMDFIYSVMPKDFEKIVASDISPEMINFARRCYGTYKKCDFKILDIGTTEDLPRDMKGQYDHVTSFYCLNWVMKRKRQAMGNIFKLLRAEGGDCLLVFLAAHPVFDAYRSMANSQKWSPYMTDVDQCVAPLDCREISTILKETGFSDIQVEVLQKEYVHKSLESFEDHLESINPFVKRMPLAMQANYMSELIDTVASFGLEDKHATKESDFMCRLPYKLVVIYAKKFPNTI